MRARITASTSKPAAMLLARTLRITPRDARRLLEADRVLPVELDAASSLIDELRHLGVNAEPVDVPPSSARCASHPTLTVETPCEACRRLVCPLCVPRCEACARTAERAARWKRTRVAALLLVLLGVCTWGLWRHRALERRNAWLRPLKVTVVLASSQPVDEKTLAAWAAGVRQLEDWFAEEAQRHRFRFSRPFELHLAPRVVGLDAPTLPSTTGEWLADSQSAIALRQRLQQLVGHGGAAGGDLDVVVGLRPAAAGAHRVEGLGEAGGSIGLVDGTNGDTTITLELLAVAHELLHLLGAKDAYDEHGHALPQRGFAEPELGYQQTYAEVMVGEVPVSAKEGRLPKSLAEVRIGDLTAFEIGWR